MDDSNKSQWLIFLLSVILVSCQLPSQPNEELPENTLVLPDPYPPPVTPIYELPYPPPHETTRIIETPHSTATRSPRITETPFPTLTPLPPTSAPKPIGNHDLNLNTLIYAVKNDFDTEIFHVQFEDNSHQPLNFEKYDTPYLQHSRAFLHRMHLSPNNEQLIVDWQYGEGGQFLTHLNISDGTSFPLFPPDSEMDKRVEFLDWHPDNLRVLVVGQRNNNALKGRMWMINIQDQTMEQVGEIVEEGGGQIVSATFSADGNNILYAYNKCYQCGSEIWQLSLDRPDDRQLIFSDQSRRIQLVSLSPSGNFLAFVIWQEGVSEPFEFGNQQTNASVGELWVINLDSSQATSLGTALTNYQNQFPVEWAGDGSRIAWIHPQKLKNVETTQLAGSIAAALMDTNETVIVSHANINLFYFTWVDESSSMLVLGKDPLLPDNSDIWQLNVADDQNTEIEFLSEYERVEPNFIWIATQEE